MHQRKPLSNGDLGASPAVTSSLDSDGATLRIRVSGRFDSSVQRAFRDAYEAGGRGCSAYVVDLSDTQYLDSSALGMLLLLRDHAGGDAATVRLVHGNPDVLKILKISNFDRLFEIV